MSLTLKMWQFNMMNILSRHELMSGRQKEHCYTLQFRSLVLQVWFPSQQHQHWRIQLLVKNPCMLCDCLWADLENALPEKMKKVTFSTPDLMHSQCTAMCKWSCTQGLRPPGQSYSFPGLTLSFLASCFNCYSNTWQLRALSYQLS